MKYVDQILDYLAGELNPKKKVQFEKDLLQNIELKKEFDRIHLIEEKLKEIYHEDIRNNSDRLKALREILYDDDLRKYGGPPESPEENELIRNIHQSMEHHKPVRKNSGLDFSIVLAVISIAATITLALIFSFHKPSDNKLFAQYFKPQKDKTLISLMESTRGDVNPGILLYFNGHYKESIEYLKSHMLNTDTTIDIRLFYLLSCLEINCGEDLSDLLKTDTVEYETEIEQAFLYYSGLYMLHNENIDGASIRLKYLTKNRNSYHKSAKRLLRKMH